MKLLGQQELTPCIKFMYRETRRAADREGLAPQTKAQLLLTFYLQGSSHARFIYVLSRAACTPLGLGK